MPSAYRHFEVTAHSLSGIGIFSGLDFDARLDVARRCSAGRFDRRTPVLTIEDDSRDVYFVIEGRVRVTVYSAGGREVSFRDIVTGMHFGDLAAIDGEPRSANVVTLENSLLAWMPPDEFWRVIKLDLWGTFLTCKHGIPALIETGGGSVINTSSNLAFMGIEGRDCYTAAKGGVAALTRSMASSSMGL